MTKKAAPKIAAQVVVFDQANRSVNIERAIDVQADMLETKTGVYHTQNATTYVDEQNGKLVYVFDADITARQEAANLKLLRRSVTLKQLFSFERSPGGVDWMKILPYIIIIAMVVFR